MLQEKYDVDICLNYLSEANVTNIHSIYWIYVNKTKKKKFVILLHAGIL